jgi:hypothetical protein
MVQFINPYSFVPLPEEVTRSKPAGHERLAAGCLSGRIMVTFRCVTPLLLRGGGRQDEDGYEDVPKRKDGAPFVPGSSLHGAIRALHETLAGGCLRVFDSEFVPVYRDQPLTNPKLRMAVVERVLDGAPVELRLCTSTVRIDHRILAAAGAGSVKTGARFDIVDGAPAVARVNGLEAAR